MIRLTYLLFLPVALVATIACQEKVSTASDPIRTYIVNGVGKNPLVIIDGKEYSADVLTRIDPDKIKGSTTFEPSFSLKKYGEKAKDGVIKLDTKAGTFTFDNERDRELTVKQIQKELALPKNQFLSKYVYEGRDGKEYEKIIIKSNGSTASSSNIHGTKVKFFLNGVEKSETEITSLNKETSARIINTSVNGNGKDVNFDFYTELPPPPPAEPNLK